MREEKTKSPSQANKRKQTKSWFWPAIYSGIAIVFVGMIWGYTALIKDSPGKTDTAKAPDNSEVVVDVNASKESFKYPFSEELLNDVAILQDYYDMEADETMRENALLVFNQSYVTNSGVSISIDGKPFEVLAAMSGVVEEVVTDVFSGDSVVLKHADGMQTVYSSMTGVLVKEGDEVAQGEPLAMTTQNEWNPAAGVHLLFEIHVDGEPVNPGKHLAFK
ncbi:M23 family metallopeptidase [Sporosarcina sp. 6E9]|uniref:M23 family metallopeptidase n=1 Tax=Sporosarcina sp. 6E9 TaxID=2819235 RepID=UPI001B307271|nr:M23 family metallopeptidase [Sporosarcina sp. 6E9]